MTEISNNKNNSNSIEFFYSNLDKMSLVGMTAEESETIIVTRRDAPEATITTSDSKTFTKIRKNLLADPEHKIWKVQNFIRTTADKDPFHFIELVATCPKKLVSLRSKTSTRELTEEQKEAMRERMSKMWKSKGTDDDAAVDEDED